MTVATDKSRGRVLTGKVLKVIDSKTARVQVRRIVMDALIKKAKNLFKSYLVETHGLPCAADDVVSIREIKPVSKRKRFELVGA